ncbi:hypothetical protein B0T10DRAFT_10388 [Thelonectria olida]|uniref:Uncharacterized protein n=1 Tax=Thelonectria olida TaxID=1576542 RepID=A0A9P9AX67_9HYPO|nr:hypothetical protein B0T10DRAFT_10388 [Thelonectria olida]
MRTCAGSEGGTYMRAPQLGPSFPQGLRTEYLLHLTSMPIHPLRPNDTILPHPRYFLKASKIHPHEPTSAHSSQASLIIKQSLSSIRRDIGIINSHNESPLCCSLHPSLLNEKTATSVTVYSCEDPVNLFNLDGQISTAPSYPCDQAVHGVGCWASSHTYSSRNNACVPWRFCPLAESERKARCSNASWNVPWTRHCCWLTAHHILSLPSDSTVRRNPLLVASCSFSSTPRFCRLLSLLSHLSALY